jgi:hypothetical protein
MGISIRKFFYHGQFQPAVVVLTDLTNLEFLWLSWVYMCQVLISTRYEWSSFFLKIIINNNNVCSFFYST